MMRCGASRCESLQDEVSLIAPKKFPSSCNFGPRRKPSVSQEGRESAEVMNEAVIVCLESGGSVCFNDFALVCKRKVTVLQIGNAYIE